MTWTKHGWASLAALVAFAVLTLVGGAWSEQSWIALGILAGVMSVLYWHYRRRNARRKQLQGEVPVTPSRDDRVIPQDVKIRVTLRDKGQCQLRYPGICLTDQDLQFDHKYPWSKGGSSKDEDNIQLACGPCNRHKSNLVPV